MALDDGLADGQAHPGAAELGADRVAAVEALEDQVALPLGRRQQADGIHLGGACGGGQVEPEDRSRAGLGGQALDGATVSLHDRLADRQPHAGAAPLTVRDVTTVEPLEDQVALVLLDADTVVLDLDDHAGPRAHRSHADQGRHAGTGVLDGVADEVGEELPQGRLVGVHRRQALVGHLEHVVGAQQRGGLHERAVRSAERDVAHVHRTGLGHGVGEEVVDQAGHLDRRLLGARDRGMGVTVGVEVEGGELEPGADRRQGAAQVVGRGRGEADEGSQALAVLGHLAQHQQGARASAVVLLGGELGARHGQHEVVAGGQPQLDVADAELGARGAGVGGCGMQHQVHQCGEGHRRRRRPGRTRWASRRLAPLLRSTRPMPSRTMSPSSMLSVISASSSACSAARARASPIRTTSWSMRSLSVPTARPVRSTATRKTWRDQRSPGAGSLRSRVGPCRRGSAGSAADAQGERVERRRGRSGTARPTRRRAA